MSSSFLRKLALSTAVSFAVAAGAGSPMQAQAQEAQKVENTGATNATTPVKKTPLTPEERKALHQKMRAARQASFAEQNKKEDEETAQCIAIETDMVKKGDSVKNHLQQYPQCARFFPPAMK
jgi:hypothetical protein